jgi:hypothetical protein
MGDSQGDAGMSGWWCGEGSRTLRAYWAARVGEETRCFQMTSARVRGVSRCFRLRELSFCCIAPHTPFHLRCCLVSCGSLYCHCRETSGCLSLCGQCSGLCPRCLRVESQPGFRTPLFFGPGLLLSLGSSCERPPSHVSCS